MHLLLAQAGSVDAGDEAQDLGQSPGDIVILSAAASELALFAEAKAALGEDVPSVRLANVMQLSHPMSVDLYVETTLSKARMIVLRLLGGAGYWSYGLEQVEALCATNGIALVVLPGDDKPDQELQDRSTVQPDAFQKLWGYCIHGGRRNAENFLRYATTLLGGEAAWQEPEPVVKAGLYAPGEGLVSEARLRESWIPDAPVMPILFYRALYQAGDTAPVDGIVSALEARRANPVPLFVSSLRDPDSVVFLEKCLSDFGADVIINCTGFSVSKPGAPSGDNPLDGADCPVLQVILSGETRDTWSEGDHGLRPRDLAMTVALPEVDGRIITRAISFKSQARFDTETEVGVIRNEAEPERIGFVADLACRWARLRLKPEAERNVAVIVANYPNKDGRLANGVGLDTPASVAGLIGKLDEAGYQVGADCPRDGAALMAMFREGSTNALKPGAEGIRYSIADYAQHFSALPTEIQDQVVDRWGAPEKDAFIEEDAFVLPAHQFGNLLLAVQPARGYNLDPTETYHDPALVPPHRYLAFYLWLREVFGADALIHFGKHGNLEWLPGKSLALSKACFPDAIMGPLPNLYPFIVNDPGEGTQAKRRSQAVVVDHMTPPLTRAETHGDVQKLERLIDEYYLASGLDPRRLQTLQKEILSLSAALRLDEDLEFDASGDETAALQKLDNYICELKELQIRDGLHIFGEAPPDEAEADLLIALTRVPRGVGEGAEASLLRALAIDAGFEGFDPLDCVFGDPWTGGKPSVLDTLDEAWRTNGDTVERLEDFAQSTLMGKVEIPPDWGRTRAVLDHIDLNLRPMLRGVGAAETNGLLTGLDGRFVPPGPSGAPSRGRLDVLPTGRNFYSVDTRAVPTPAAWTLGWKSASLLLDGHFQEHGEFPRQIAMSAWGTANMRTGGDDIAQALALLGARPQWDDMTGRVTGFEILPLSVLGRPRVDILFRVSGFFRDAFPFQLDMLDSAIRAVAAQDEPDSENPLAANVREEQERLIKAGAPEEDAKATAAQRVFGSKPGAYGAGLQALIDEGIWSDTADLAEAYLTWGGYAYGGGQDGATAHDQFRAQLGRVDTILHNQDNREHDLLDSDDYYQFEGGLAAAVRTLSGSQPRIYHNDHSRPESPKIRSLRDEINRIVRARAANPKWIKGVMRHGYKGAFEMAATVDYLFAFAATSGVVSDHHFDQLYDAYLADDDVCSFIETNNPDALREMAARFAEAVRRELWHPRSNSAARHLETLMKEDAHVSENG